jgi:hypothetical protein
MAAKLNNMKSPRDAKLWQSAFVAAEIPALLRLSPKRISPEGAAHLAAEYADAAVTEYRRRFK